MTKTSSILAVLAVCLMGAVTSHGESIFQTVNGDAANAGNGGSAIAGKLMETKTLPDGATVARVLGSVVQWGYVNYWFGLPSPAGNTIIRVKVYNDGTDTAGFAFYVKRSSGDPLVLRITIPADAKKEAITTIDLPVEMDTEWNGLAFKKIVASDKPSPWIQSVSIVTP